MTKKLAEFVKASKNAKRAAAKLIQTISTTGKHHQSYEDTKLLTEATEDINTILEKFNA